MKEIGPIGGVPNPAPPPESANIDPDTNSICFKSIKQARNVWFSSFREFCVVHWVHKERQPINSFVEKH